MKIKPIIDLYTCVGYASLIDQDPAIQIHVRNSSVQQFRFGVNLDCLSWFAKTGDGKLYDRDGSFVEE